MVLMLPCRVCGSTEHERDSHGRCVDTRRCLDRRSARDAATRAEQNHRLTGPPAFADADPGTCRWCGGAIVHGRRGARRWHDGREEEPDCLLDYRVANDQLKPAWVPLIERDGDGCQGCGVTVVKRVDYPAGERWNGRKMVPYPAGHFWAAADWREAPHVDHKVPVADGGKKTLANLQLLCPPCHKAKTKREAGQRARGRRDERSGQTSLGGEAA